MLAARAHPGLYPSYFELQMCWRRVLTPAYTRHTSSCRCVGGVCSPRSHSGLCSRGFAHLPRDSAYGLTPSGPAQALFKTVNRFVMQLELFRVYPVFGLLLCWLPGHIISLCSRGFARLPPFCNSNYLGYTRYSGYCCAGCPVT